MSPAITDASARLDLALTLCRQDPRSESEHLTAALRATGDLQRALILEQLRLEGHRARGQEDSPPKRTAAAKEIRAGEVIK
jgi:hypothetical protein